jgi:hypothetical protein
VFITLDNLKAHPAKEYSTATTYHLVASVYFGDRKLAVRALLRALLNVKKVQLLFHLDLFPL